MNWYQKIICRQALR